MRFVWTLVKVAIGLAIAIPVTILALGAAIGVLGALVGLAAFALKLAVVALLAVGCVKLLSRLVRGPSPASARPMVRELPPVDPHYEAAMRELDRELGHPR